VKPGEDATQRPIQLSDMPVDYHLVLEPSLVVAVGPPARAHPWLWVKGLFWEGWTRVTASGSWLKLVLLPEDARSLAWLVTDGMPFLIGRTTVP
jgi:hypothetical protein